MREQGAQQKRAFSASGGTSESILVAPRRSRALFLALRVALEDAPGAPGTIPRHVNDTPDRPRELLGRPGGPQKAHGTIFASILGALGTSWELFCLDAGSIPNL